MNKIILQTSSGLARKMNIAQQTLIARAMARGVEPDAILMGGNGKNESLLWNMERLPELRNSLGNKQDVIV